MVSVLPGPQDEPLLFPGQGPAGRRRRRGQLIDSEVRRIVEECYAEADGDDHRPSARSSSSLTKALLERETLDRPTRTPPPASPAASIRSPKTPRSGAA